MLIPMAATLLFACAALSAGLTICVRRYAASRMLIDVPNFRSSHTVPTPRGGGIAIVATFVSLTAGMTFSGHIPGSVAYSFLPGALLIAAVGWLDDRGHVDPKYRLSVHCIAAIPAAIGVGGLSVVPVGNFYFDFGLPGYLFVIVTIVWLTNLFNFMDGIDGIAGVEAVTVAGCGALLLLWRDDTAAGFWVAGLACICLGFLIHNWPPARIFMGDVGSGFLGFTFGFIAFWTASTTEDQALGTRIESALSLGGSIYIWAILLGAFVVDSTVTLIRRLVNGEKVFEAHRSHAYQRAARRFSSHRNVTIATAIINVFWLFPLAAVAATFPRYGLPLVVVAWSPLLYLAWLFKAGVPDEKLSAT